MRRCRSRCSPCSVLAAAPALAASSPPVAQGPLTLLQAITLGRSQGVERGHRPARRPRRPTPASASAGPTCCPPSAATRVTRQTLNLDEFGIPIATGVTDPFDIYRLQLRASQTIFDASA